MGVVSELYGDVVDLYYIWSWFSGVVYSSVVLGVCILELFLWYPVELYLVFVEVIVWSFSFVVGVVFVTPRVSK